MDLILQKLFYPVFTKNITNLLPHYQSILQGCTNILDVGSGNGLQAKIISESLQKKITCLDISDHRWGKTTNLPFKIYDGLNFPFPSKRFDACLIFLVLHHTQSPDAILKESLRVSTKRILILEETFTNPIQLLLMIIYDLLLNTVIFGQKISTPKFKKNQSWEDIFGKLNLRKIEKINLSKKWYYPPQRMIYILHK